VLGNHDNVRIATRYGGGAPGSGHGDQILGRQRAKAATLLTLALPGSAYLYQGDELELPEVVDLPLERITDPIYRRTAGARRGRDGCRVPLPWSGTAAPYGFSTTGDTWLPQPDYFAGHTAEARINDPDSALTLYRKALELRRKYLADELPVQWLPSQAGVLAFTRGGFTCVANLTDEPATTPLPSTPQLSSGATAAGVIPGNTTSWWYQQ
jgi:alpha-glucosidase